MVLSGIVALTLTPALSVMILKREHKQPGRFFEAFNRFFARTTDRYEDGVAWMMRRGAIASILFVVMVVAAVFLWRATPGSLVPDEDQGFYIAVVLLPDGSSLERTDEMVQKVVAAVKENPNIENTVAFTGFDFIGGGTFRNNAATIFVTMKHWDEREHGPTAQELVGEFFGRTGGFKEGLAIAFNAPPIFALGATGGFEMHLQSRGDGGAQRLAQVSQMFIGSAMQEPGIAQAQMFWRPNVPQLFVDVDREKAKSLGVPIDEVFNALAATLGTYYVNDFNKYGRTWQVLMSSEARYRKRPDDVGNIYVRSERGEMVPIRALATVKYTNGPDTLERFNNMPAVTDPGLRRARRELGPGAGEDREGRQGSAALGLQLRLERRVVPGEALGRHLDRGAGRGRGNGFPDPCRPVRALVVAVLGHAGVAVRHLRGARGDLVEQPRPHAVAAQGAAHE